VAERIEIDDVTFAYEDTSDGAPVVLFLHGLGGSANGWLAQLQAGRERGWRGVALDQRGAGRSDAPPGPYSVELWAQDAVRLLDELAIERAALVGHSVGCMIAARAAQLLGERVWGLALCGGTLEWPEGAAEVFAERAALARAGRTDEIADAVTASGLSERCRHEDPRLVGLMREAIASNEGGPYALWAEATAEGRIEGPETIACPVLAFCGSEDAVTPPAAAEQIAAAVGRAQMALIEGAAHWCQLEDPEAVTSTLFAFFEPFAPAG
jgi:pimeloyl-ACP methyl ester carboxylesterase